MTSATWLSSSPWANRTTGHKFNRLGFPSCYSLGFYLKNIMPPLHGRLSEFIVLAALKDLQKKRPVVGNNKEETSALLYFFAISASVRELNSEFTVGLDLGAKTNPFGTQTFLRHFRIFHQVGRSSCIISELGDICGSDRSSDQVARSNFLSTCLDKAAKISGAGLAYPSRPRNAYLLQCGILIHSSFYGVRLLPGWKAGVTKMLAFRCGATPWHSLAIILLRKYELNFALGLTRALCDKVKEVFDPHVSSHFVVSLMSEVSRFKTQVLSEACPFDDPLASCAPTEDGGGDLWEAKRRIAILEAFIAQKGFDLP